MTHLPMLLAFLLAPAQTSAPTQDSASRAIEQRIDRFDIANAVTYSPGYVTLHGAAEQLDITGGSHSIAASTAARYWLRPPGRPLSWQVHTGVGMAIGGKPSYLDLFETSTLNAVLGTTVRYQVGQLVSLTVKVQHRLFTLRSGQPAGSGSRPLQMRFGVGFPMLEKLM